MKCPWSITEELEKYTQKHGYVSSACRLSTEEEMLLLELCGAESRERLSLTLLNRKAFVGAVTSLSTLPKDKTLTVQLGKEKPPVIENFDFGADYTIIENPRKTMTSAKFFGGAYARPENVSIPVSCGREQRMDRRLTSFMRLFCRSKWRTVASPLSNLSTMQ